VGSSKLSTKERLLWMKSPFLLTALGIAAASLGSIAKSLPSHSVAYSFVKVMGLLILSLLVILILWMNLPRSLELRIPGLFRKRSTR
jgi:hypothetical protein